MSTYSFHHLPIYDHFPVEEKTTIIALKHNTFWLAFYMISAILKRNRSNILPKLQPCVPDRFRTRSGKKQGTAADCPAAVPKKSEVHNYDCHEMVLLFSQKAQSKYGAGTCDGHGDLNPCHRQANCLRFHRRRRHHCRKL